jgi:multimeric flavodoxin WrbA
MGSDTSRAQGQKILVAYYSMTGNTARVARDIAARTGADLESLRDPSHGTGFFGFIKASVDTLRGSVPKVGPLTRDITGYDLTIIGTPVWARRMTPAIRAYLQITRGRLLPALERAAAAKALASAGFNQQELKNPGVYDAKLTAFLNALGLPLTARERRGGEGAKAA